MGKNIDPNNPKNIDLLIRGKKRALHISQKTNYSANFDWMAFDSEASYVRYLSEANRLTEAGLVIFFMSVLFNGMLYLSYRKAVYLHYIGYLMAFCLWVSWVRSYLLLDNFEGSVGYLYANLLHGFAVIFTISFLDMRARNPRITSSVGPYWA